ncbi:DinB family protein [Paenibacillus sp. 481]|uniref:DinB family protein n=1 Tax=Paenibacillus sp. 481 TaxID=2835869 RepID=UPI001E4DB519|nr:DinB family protein [Paenibacillus sp. 481]UHA71954.1 DinB family protein [Paenibacillus sp. 481]
MSHLQTSAYHPIVQSTLHHIAFAVDSIEQVMLQIPEEAWHYQPSPATRTIQELLAHLTLLLEADLLLMEGTSATEMERFYKQHTPQSRDHMLLTLRAGYEKCEAAYLQFSEQQLNEETKAYWGASYTRFGWLVEMNAHLYHHRGQLLGWLQAGGWTVKISWFE